ncbi:MAG: pantoate--beta-alanine ligase [Solirubrobacterales bacterium]|nr:pantoate--beta-alanine ligase [Solirubrobacterales bacterium]
MRELERDFPDRPDTACPPRALKLAVVGIGRAGGAVARAAAEAGIEVTPAGRRDALEACLASEAAILSVPDDEIAVAAEAVSGAAGALRFAGHLSGAGGLELLAPLHARGTELFSLHPLQTLPDAEASLAGAWCAVTGSSRASIEFAREICERLGMRPFEVPDEARAAYHAAASIASNLMIALEESAVELLERAGVAQGREALVPLVLRSAANWADLGPGALTGPIVRGDETTVAMHRAAIATTAPELSGAYEALAERARGVARSTATPPGSIEAGQAGIDRLAASVPAPDPGRPLLVRSKAELDAALSPARAAGDSIGLVPTMGFLHEGHRSLLRAARDRSDVVVMSLFVNPAQFRPGEDLASYPRDEAGDLAAAAADGVDIVYAPRLDEVYPEGFATAVKVRGGLTDVLCGDPARRGPAHFDGVTTVVAKLLSSVRPMLAFFGQKDAQQAIVVRRMARDLDLPVEIVAMPTVREPDGLAMSSRNAYLTSDERRRAPALYAALSTARDVALTSGDLGRGLTAARRLLAEAGVQPEYLEARDAEDLSAVSELGSKPVLVALASRLGSARLIDNIVIESEVTG